jgi:hypothetical protein
MVPAKANQWVLSVVRNSHVSIATTTVPARGVHSPAMRRSPAPAKDAKVIIVCNGGSFHSFGPAPKRRTEPTTRRMTSKPRPGQLLANVE